MVLNNLIFLILRISLFSGFFLRNLTCTTLSIIVHSFKQQLQAILPILHRSNDVPSCARLCEIQETCCYCVELRQFFIRKIVLCHYRIRFLNVSVSAMLVDTLSKKISLKFLFLSDIFLFPFIRQQFPVLT